MNHAGMGSQAIVISNGQERSVAQTRSFASMYLATAAFAAINAGKDELLYEMDSLPAIGERLIARYDGWTEFYFLGSGIRYGLACEMNLKMKEMTLTHSEPFHFLEFRHGPMSMVSPSTLLVGLLSDRNRAYETAVLDEMRLLGGRTLSLAECEADIDFESGLAEACRGVLYLPVLQLMAYYRALAKGLNPDTPTNLSAVVQLEL
jgi:glucosamine--fructose-6-phosphate aminotransferase (isomerizing)